MKNPVDAVSALVSGGQAPTAPPSGVRDAPAVPPSRESVPGADTVEISPAAIQAARSNQADPPRRTAPSQQPPAREEPVQAPRKPQPDPEVSFSFNKDLGVMTKQVVDPRTGKVEREIPPEALVELRVRIQQAVESFKSRHGRPASGGLAKGARADAASEEAA